MTDFGLIERVKRNSESCRPPPGHRLVMILTYPRGRNKSCRDWAKLKYNPIQIKSHGKIIHMNHILNVYLSQTERKYWTLCFKTRSLPALKPDLIWSNVFKQFSANTIFLQLFKLVVVELKWEPAFYGPRVTFRKVRSWPDWIKLLPLTGSPYPPRPHFSGGRLASDQAGKESFCIWGPKICHIQLKGMYILLLRGW